MESIVVDIGNTNVKIAHFSNEKIISKKIFSDLVNLHELYDISIPVIISPVGSIDKVNYSKMLHPLVFNVSTKLPIQIDYKTPNTLGLDRIAVCVAVANRCNNLIIDVGSCITYDFIDKNDVYQGGYILPGIEMRFKSMHNFTDKLPLIKNWKNNFDQLDAIGKSTEECMAKGVLRGIVNEMDAFILDFNKKYPDLKVHLTGGDTDFFDLALKNSIFADENLVLFGLNKVLLHNQ